MGRQVTKRELHLIRTGRITRKNHCSKHGYTQAKAIRMAHRAQERTGEKIYAYPCIFCDDWHIGHSR